jgi:hypothetical protein
MWFDGPVDDDDPDAIWRSDDVPVRSTPIDTGSVTDRAATTDELALDPLQAGEGPQPRRLRPVAVVAAVAAVAVAATVVGFVAGRSDGSDESAPSRTTAPTTTPADTIAGEPVERTDLPAAAERLIASVPEQIELPPPVAAISAPTEVVALSRTGLLHTISLPSGRVRTIDLDSSSASPVADGFSALTVSPDAAAVGAVGSRVVIAPRSGAPVAIGLEGDPGSGRNVEGWIRAGEGSTQFVVASHPAQGGAAGFSLVGLDGAVDAPPDFPDPSQYRPGPPLQGELVVNDAGGAYRIAPDGTSTRIEDGVVHASDERHRLVRECDEHQRCSTAVVGVVDGTRRVIDPSVLQELPLVNGFLSPDGSALALLRSGPQEQERVILDLDIGEVAAVPSDTWLAGSTWAGDGSGVFDLAQGQLRFLDRATGETVTLAEELGPFVSIGVRRPDAELPAEPPVVSTALTPQQSIGPTGLVLVTSRSGGGVGVLTVDELDLTSWRGPFSTGVPQAVATSGDAVLVLPRAADRQPPFLTTPDTDTLLADTFTTGDRMLLGPSDDTIWVPDDDAPPDGLRYRLLRLDGSTPDDVGSAVVDLTDATLLGGDGRGALVVERRGDVFVVGADGGARLTSGELVAIGATTAYVRECASVLECALVRIDRTTDAHVPVSGNEVVLDNLSNVDGYRGVALGSTVSPDGDVVVSSLAVLDGGLEPAMRTVLFDVRSGEVTFVDGLHYDEQPVVWNDASTFAALLVDSEVRVYDRAAGRTIGLAGSRVNAIGPGPSTER